jgi:hypothetical protein
MASFMVKNVGSVDRLIRVIIGLALFSLVFWGPKTMWGIIGIVPIFTALAGWCPMYSLLGISSCPMKAAK